MQRRGQITKLLSAHSDMTYQEIGGVVGCSRQRVQKVHQAMRRAGLIGDKKSRLYREDVTIERVLELYYRSTLFVEDIARILSCHINTLRKRLRAAGISKSECYSRRQKLHWSRVREATRMVAK